MRLNVSKRTVIDLYQSLSKAVAMYDLLHSHARGETDLTEDQLASVVTGLTIEARETLDRARGSRPPVLPRGHRWADVARRRASRHSNPPVLH